MLAARAAGDDARATLAFDVYAHRLRRELGGMIAVLGGLDVLVFTGGVGEHAPEVRAAACEIGPLGDNVQTLVVPAREDIEIARQVRLLPGAATSITSSCSSRKATCVTVSRFVFDFQCIEV